MFTSRTALAVPLAAAALGLAHPGAAQATTKAIASATARDFRVVVTETPTSGGAAPTATARVHAYVHTATGWHSRGEAVLGTRNGFFAKVLQGGRAVNDLTISNVAPDHGSVQLLVTPALGYSPAYHFHMSRDRLVLGSS